MTRTEFNVYFSATQDTTNGFTDKQLDRINEVVFSYVRDLDPWASAQWQVVSEQVQTVMERIMNIWYGSKRPEAAS